MLRQSSSALGLRSKAPPYFTYAWGGFAIHCYIYAISFYVQRCYMQIQVCLGDGSFLCLHVVHSSCSLRYMLFKRPSEVSLGCLSQIYGSHARTLWRCVRYPTHSAACLSWRCYASHLLGYVSRETLSHHFADVIILTTAAIKLTVMYAGM